MVKLREADLVIRPKVRHLNWTDFDMTSEIIAAGEQAALENLDETKKLAQRNYFILEIDCFIRKLE